MRNYLSSSVKNSKRFYQFGIAMIIAGIGAVSCSPSELTEPNAVPTEKVHIQLEGAIDLSIAEDAGSLITYGPATAPFLRPEEYRADIRLDNNATLRLLAYNTSFNPPFSTVWQYSAYPISVLSDRTAYLVAQYIDAEGEVLFTTTFENTPPDIQVNALEILQVSANGFSARLRDLTLYEVHAAQRSGEDYPGDRITINGTFTSVN